jgi:alkanesulfonate monooxygenase SsuD/methylene tetrahydromethanopterin reductase-like flavin-dependent oxidoreductase (luciferase family)
MKFALTLYMERYSDTESMGQAAENALELVKIAEEGGFDVVFTAEHHTIELTASPNPFVTLAYWAANTSRIRLGTGVVSAPYWNPIRLAGEAALLDVLSGGRLELGLGRGSYQYEFDRMANGMPQLQGAEYLTEIIPAVQALWAGEYSHEGKHWSFPTTTSVPKPVQDRPPMWVAARGPETFDLAVQNGCNIMATPLHKPFSEVEALKQRFDDSVRKNSPSFTPQLLIQQRACVYDQESDWEAPVNAVREYALRFETLFKNTGLVRNGFPERADAASLDNNEDLQPESLRENLLFGTVDQVVEKLRKFEKLGIDYFAYGGSYGLPHDVAKRSLELFTQEVMPHFREAD